MKNIRIFLSENFHFLVEKFSVYLNRLVFVMVRCIEEYLDKLFSYFQPKLTLGLLSTSAFLRRL